MCVYPAAWAAAADMLVEALSGAQLISLEQVRRRGLGAGGEGSCCGEDGGLHAL
jgi:hypothetical protein